MKVLRVAACWRGTEWFGISDREDPLGIEAFEKFFEDGQKEDPISAFSQGYVTRN